MLPSDLKIHNSVFLQFLDFLMNKTMQRIIVYIFGADCASLGRLDYTTLSSQALMELLVADLRDINKFQDQSGNFLDVTDWFGVAHIDSDVAVYISWRGVFSAYFPQGGSIDTQWIPPTVESVDIHNNELEGTIQTALLPRCLEILDVSKNEMTGEFCVANLPSGIKRVRIEKNQFCGPIEVSALPQSVEYFIVSANKLSGTLDFSNVSSNAKELRFAENSFSGSVDFGALPENLQYLDIRYNPISQDEVAIPDTFKRRLYCIAWSPEQIRKVYDSAGNEIDDDDLPKPSRYEIFTRSIRYR